MKTLTLAAKIGVHERFTRFVGDFARANGFKDDKARELELVVEELVVNIINYAYPIPMGSRNNDNSPISLSCDFDKIKGLVIEIRDRGVKFNPSNAPEPDITLDIENRPIGGLGIYLVKHLVDEFHYHREGEENILVLIKKTV